MNIMQENTDLRLRKIGLKQPHLRGARSARYESADEAAHSKGFAVRERANFGNRASAGSVRVGVLAGWKP
jgi:hypothetical protein